MGRYLFLLLALFAAGWCGSHWPAEGAPDDGMVYSQFMEPLPELLVDRPRESVPVPHPLILAAGQLLISLFALVATHESAPRIEDAGDAGPAARPKIID